MVVQIAQREPAGGEAAVIELRAVVADADAAAMFGFEGGLEHERLLRGQRASPLHRGREEGERLERVNLGAEAKLATMQDAVSGEQPVDARAID